MSSPFTVVGNNSLGYCVELTGSHNGLFCSEEMSKAPFFVPKGNGDFAPRDVIGNDQMVARQVAIGGIEHCSVQMKHVLCGYTFQPCPNSETPGLTGVCKSACDALCDCYHGCGSNGDYGSLCSLSWSVNNTGSSDLLCGTGSNLRVHRTTLIGLVALSALHAAALLI